MKYLMRLAVYAKGDQVTAEDIRSAIEKGRGRVESVLERRSAAGLWELTFFIRLDELSQSEGILDGLEDVRGIIALQSGEPRKIKELRRA